MGIREAKIGQHLRFWILEMTWLNLVELSKLHSSHRFSPSCEEG